MHTPHPVQRYQMFYGHFKVESRVTSVAWADAYPSNFFLLFQTSLLDWKCWKSNVKIALGHLRGLPGAPKSAKKVLCISKMIKICIVGRPCSTNKRYNFKLLRNNVKIMIIKKTFYIKNGAWCRQLKKSKKSKN
jgi:hypothetical protein